MIQKYCTLVKNKLTYSNTIFLPKTKFPLRLGKTRDERINNEFEDYYIWQTKHLSEPTFVLHDGPPYANGSPHMGHAINKILKDTILRCEILKGRKVHYVPGWDCHGLPIELKATTETKQDPVKIRLQARHFAEKVVKQQQTIFKSWGILGNWNNSYCTSNANYVKKQLKLFYELYEKKFIYRDFKPIYWSPSSKTALAEAELEYNEQHISPSIYLRLKLLNNPDLYALIWTTTPWTLPSNQAICYNPNINYAIVKNPNDNCCYLIATDLIENLSKLFQTNLKFIESFPNEKFAFINYNHPIYKDNVMSFLPSSHITITKGTGLVHTAPAHGPTDFLVALEHKIPVVDLVNEFGCYKENVNHSKLENKFVLTEGNEIILNMIKKDLVHFQEFNHSYPYDWRTKQPVIIRASQQWFMDTEKIKHRAIQLLENVKVFPQKSSEKSKNNLINQIAKRPYWCISRQRMWGVPIPVFYNKANEQVLIDSNLIQHYSELIDKYGTDFWWKLPKNTLLSPITKDLTVFDKGQDILDIWFDSGISWAVALENHQIANMYLEGADQFTGWFQSSLLTSIALRDQLPYQSIYVHGLAVDANGMKMSKSLGNVIDPQDIIKELGVDVLRWWVISRASQDSIVSVNKNVLNAAKEDIQKIRNVMKFILGSLFDFEPNYEINYKNLLIIDKYLLHLLTIFNEENKKFQEAYEFTKSCKSVINLLSNSVSALYFTSIKDRLYCDSKNSKTRKCAQFILWKIYEIITQTIAPIVPHLVEETYSHLPFSNKTYFNEKHFTINKKWFNPELESFFKYLLDIKKEINQQIGPNTINFDIKIELSSHIKFENVCNNIQQLEFELQDILQVAEVSIKTSHFENKDFHLTVTPTKKFVCIRCRRAKSNVEGMLCKRCTLFKINK